MAVKYTTELAFNRFLQMDVEVPGFVSGETPSKENLGTGDSSNTIFYFDQKYPITNSETLYTGSTSLALASVALTRGTHYTVDYDKSKVTLTAAGVTSVATNVLAAEYSYNKFGIKPTYITELLERAEAEVDEGVNSVFTDPLVSAPLFTSVVNEIHEGKGDFLRIYGSDFYPLNPAQALVSGALSSGATTISVISTTNGFPNTGYLGIGNDKIQYTGKTANSFTGVTSVATDHVHGETVTNWVVERSLTSEGTFPTFETLAYGSDYDVDLKAGEFKINNDTVIGAVLFDNWQPSKNVWNRFRLTYNYGYDTIPGDIVRLVHLIAAYELYNSQVLNALGRGTNGFETGSVSDSKEWIKTTIDKYRCVKVSNLN